LLTFGLAFSMLISSCSSSVGSGESTENQIAESSEVKTSTTLSAAEQTASDEVLVRKMFYERQQLLQGLSSADARGPAFDFDVQTAFPPYIELFSKAELSKCRSQYIDSGVDEFNYVPQLGSSVSTPEWILTTDGKSWKFQPSDSGRTYLIRVKSTQIDDASNLEESDIHYVIIDEVAYWFPNLDWCLGL